MAKRKSARTKATRKATKAAGQPARGRSAAAGRRKGASATSRAAGRKKTAAAVGRKAAKKTTRKAAPRKAAPRKTGAPKAAAPKATATRTAKQAARTATPPAAPRAAKSSPTPAPAKATAPKNAAKKAPVNREAATTRHSEPTGDRPSIPSSLNAERGASQARSGREETKERIRNHTETGPAMTAGDVDADWEQAYSSGDEAPGGDNPTPDQDVVDDIGRALGVEYQDSEELKGANKISERDRHRWELDPASSEDYPER